MAHVVVLDSINEDIFVCGVCKSVFNSLQIFLDHKRLECRNEFNKPNAEAVNQSSGPLTTVRSTCENFSTITQNHEKNQYVPPCNPGTPTETWTNEVSCNLCRKPFKKVKSLLAHLKTHSDRPYQCTICGRCFVQNSHLQRHIVSHKVWPDGLTKTTPQSPEAELLGYACSYCDTVLPNYSQFRVHLKKHLPLKKFKCIQDGCRDLYLSIDSLLQHISTAHNTTVYGCHICSQSFPSLEDIATHQQTHNESGKAIQGTATGHFKCSQCDAIFKKPEKLSLHLLTENHKKTCIHCNKMFASDKRLRLHLQIHRKSKPFECNLCNSSFHMKKYLSSHMLKHGDKHFVCSICKFKFKRKDLLQRHMKSHQTKKTFKCPFQETLDCRKEFSRSDKLKSHIKSHTKRMLTSSSSHKPPYDSAGTVEICIVPLDANIATN